MMYRHYFLRQLERKVLMLFILFGALIWVLDAVFDYYFFRKASFLDLLILNIPPHQGFIRFLFLICFAFFGLLVTMILRKYREAAEDLGRESMRLQSLLNVTGGILLILDPTGSIVLINRKGCDLLEVAQEKAIGQNWFDSFLPRHNRGAVRQLFKAMMNGEMEPLETFENEVLTASGRERLVAWNNHFLRDADGRIISAVRWGQDMTDQKDSAAKLKEFETKYKLLFEYAGSAIFIADVATGVIRDCNHEAETLVGRSREEIVGMYQASLHPEARQQHYRELFRQNVEAGELIEEEVEVQHKDGRIIPVCISGHVKKIGDQELAIGIFTDVSKGRLARKVFQDNMNELRRLWEVSVSRENSLIELKRQVNQLSGELGREAPYNLSSLRE